MVLKKWFTVLFICFLFSCKQGQKSNKKEYLSGVISGINSFKKNRYDFDNPELFKLNNALQEISGLSFYNGFIYTHNDEEGRFFKINPENGKIVKEVWFGKDADYEGIAVFKEKVIIVKSNGNLSFFDIETEKLKIRKNKLKQENDVEGLCLRNDDELLIACKGQMLDDDLKNKAKAIYSYNIEKDKLNKKPYLTIKDKDLEKYLKEEFKNLDISKKKKKQMKNRALSFSPSGIAIHPKTKNIYVTSAKGSLLVVFNANKALEEIIFLNEKQLPQPEGICFDNQSNLYISTETKGSVGRIYKYPNH